MKIVYIAHPVSGDIQGNINRITTIVRLIALEHKNILPFAPYVVDLLALDDNNPFERQRGIENDIELFKRKIMDEVWLYGDKISNGMLAEIKLAHSLGIKVIAKSEATKKLYDANRLF